MFYGVVIYIYFFDNKKHNKPHIHVKYAGSEVVLGLPDGEIMEGSIPNNKMKLVEAWIEIHKEDLLANWELAVNGQEVFKIEPTSGLDCVTEIKSVVVSTGLVVLSILNN